MIGSGIGGMYTFESQLKVLAERGPRKVSPFTIPSLIGNMCSGLVAIEIGARGPNFGLVSACATGTHAIGEAAHAIRRGDVDVMVAGGSEAAITPFAYASFCSMKAMSTRNDSPQTASRPFDKNRDGFIMGEGSGILGHIFGGKQNKVEDAVSATSGMDSAKISQLLKMAAPIIMGILGNQKRKDNVGQGGIGDLLGSVLGSGSSHDQSMLESFLDRDGDGNIANDMGKLFKDKGGMTKGLGDLFR